MIEPSAVHGLVPYCPGCQKMKAELVLGGSVISICTTEASTRFVMKDGKCENCRVPILWKKVNVTFSEASCS